MGKTSFYDGQTAYIQIDPSEVEALRDQAIAAAAAALASEQSADASEANASASASAALTSEQNADASEAAALASQISATASATSASTNASSASTSATNAQNSATTATNAATSASGSASSASTSATNASNSAASASTSASAAATSASNAAVSESNAAAAVQLAAGTSNPTMDGSVAVGTSNKWAREDHRHPSDTSRAPLASPALTGNPTAPTQTARNNSTLLATTAYVDSATREKLTASRTYYVRSDGSDSNTGLSNTSGGAFLTLQKSMDVIAGLDLAIYNVTVNVAAGTYAPLILKTCLGAGTVTFVGDQTTPSNVVISNSGPAVSSSAVGTEFILSGFRVQSSTGSDVAINSPCRVTLDKMDYNGSSNNYRVYANGYGKIAFSGTSHTIRSGGIGFILCDQFGLITSFSVTYTIAANLAFSGGFATARFLGYMEVTGSTFSLGGFTVTGPRYAVAYNGGIAGTGGAANFFPGSTAGSASVGGFYG